MATQYTAGFSAGDVLTAANMNSIGAASEAYTPVVTQNGTVTATTNYAQYFQINKLVFGTVYMTVTGTGTTNNAVRLSLPITAKSGSLGVIVGSGMFYDASAVNLYVVQAFLSTTTAVHFFSAQTGTGSDFGIIPNIPLGLNDQIRTTFMYEAA